MGWQPIATSTKETDVLVFDEKWQQCVVARNDARWGWRSVPGQYGVRPTHWMPLPEPPKAKQ